MTPEPFLVRLPKDADLMESLMAVCREKGLTCAAIQMVGALRKASLSFYSQDDRKYLPKLLNEPLEILSGLGNLSLKAGRPFIHLHLTLADKDCRAFGGHAQPGCVIFAGEAFITPLPGQSLTRVFDDPTGLFLWEQ